MRCFDGDPVNRSLGQIKALNVEKLDLLNDEGVVMRSRYDALINRFLTEEAVFLVDSGATAFLPFWTFIVESDVISTLRTAGRGVYIHIPISGGDMLNDTLLGFQTLAETAAEKSLVVWINEYFGEIERDGKTFDQMQVFQDNREKVLTSIGIPQRSPDLYGSDIRHMRERKLTFEEAISVDPISTSWKNGGSIASAANCSNNWRKHHSREVLMPNFQTPPRVNAPFAREKLPLSVRDAAVYLGVSPQTVYLWVERKQIPHLRVMGRNIRFLKSELAPFRAQFKQQIGNGET